MPKISCIMPVYNTEKYLEECIDSILNQTFADFEFIISDDGSTDKSKEIIKKYAEKDSRIVFLNNPKNRGICANLNDCINIAKWEYIAIMESDDISLEDRFQNTMKCFIENPEMDLVGSQWMLCNANGKIYLDSFIDLNKSFLGFQDRYLFRHTFVAPTVTFRKDIIDIVGLFEYDWLWDFYFYSRILFCEHKFFHCINCDYKWAIKRVHKESLGRSKFIKIEKLYKILRLKLIEDFHLEKYQKKLIYKTYIIYYQRIAIFIISRILDSIGLYEIVASFYQRYILRKKPQILI